MLNQIIKTIYKKSGPSEVWTFEEQGDIKG